MIGQNKKQPSLEQLIDSCRSFTINQKEIVVGRNILFLYLAEPFQTIDAAHGHDEIVYRTNRLENDNLFRKHTGRFDAQAYAPCI